MKVALLGYKDAKLIEHFRKCGDEVIWEENKITPEWISERRIEFIVSFGYRWILKREVLALLPDRAINIHISLLPWNRGADPNLWSFVEDSPKGVTIHLLDRGVDTGDIIAQSEIHFKDPSLTLKNTYDTLLETARDLLIRNWDDIRAANFNRTKQSQNAGSHHLMRDKEKILHVMPQGYDTPIGIVEKLGREWRENQTDKK